MKETQSSEVEKVLLYIGDARERARRAADAVAKDGAESHIVDALAEAEIALGELQQKLTQATLYAIPEDTLKLAV
jgi:hypothetical protein